MSLRLSVFFVAMLTGVIWVAILTLLIPNMHDTVVGSATVDSATVGNLLAGSFAGDLLLDRNTSSFIYPFTIQNLMWIIFFIGAGELLVRYIVGSGEAQQLNKRLLPEDEETVLRKRDLGKIYSGVRNTGEEGKFWMQRLLSRSILAFQITGSTSQANSVFNSTLELCQHEADLRYNLLKYIVWLIPTLGFIGTVVGIALALKSAGYTFEAEAEIASAAGTVPDLAKLGPQLMKGLTKQLGVAFYTTLLALLQSAVLMFAMHLVQGREENALNRIGQYCLDNLINRLYEK